MTSYPPSYCRSLLHGRSEDQSSDAAEAIDTNLAGGHLAAEEEEAGERLDTRWKLSASL